MKKYLLPLSFLFTVFTILLLNFQFDSMPKSYTLEDFRKWRIEKKKQAKPSYGMPDKAMQWYYSQRAYPNNEIPANWRSNAMAEISNDKRLSKAAGELTWTQLGPGNIGGRIRSIVVNPKNANIIYIGSVSGGVWKTTNGGTSWVPLKDDMENLSVSSLVMDPDDSNILYAGTGEGFFNFDAIRGEGIFKSTNAGASWERLASTYNDNFTYVNKLEFDKVNKILWAATRAGLYKSTNGGTSFSRASTASGASPHVADVEIAYTTPVTVYATTGLLNQSAVYVSRDAGQSFTKKFSYTNTGRIELAVSKSNPNAVVISALDLSTYGVKLMRYSSNAGETWDSIKVPGPAISGPETYTSAQAWYNNILAFDPSNENIIYAGGLDLWKSLNKGAKWEQVSNWYPVSGYANIHADLHAITFSESSPDNIYVGNDGGIYRSTNKGLSWSKLNNDLHITQFYYGAVDPSSNKYYGGTQDNGTLKSDGTSSWKEILGGDGGATEVDYSNPNIVYMEYVNLAIFKSTNGGTSYNKAMNGIPNDGGTWSGTSDRVEFIAPFSMDPNNSGTLYAGTYRLFKTTNGAASWTAISGDLTGSGAGSTGATISTISPSKANSNVIYVGCSNGRIQVTSDGGASWFIKSVSSPKLYVKRFAVSPTDPSVAYVVYSGFTDGMKVFKTTNMGSSWTNISNNLPNVPVNAIVINPHNQNNLVVGTDLGIFSTYDDGKTWAQDNRGLANVSIADIDYRASDHKIFAATHGRGMFSAPMVDTQVGVEDEGVTSAANYELSQNYPNPFNPSTTIKYSIPGAGNVRIAIYDMSGRQVAELVNSYQAAGSYTATWNGMNSSGKAAASGVYLYTIQSGRFTETRKMTLLK